LPSVDLLRKFWNLLKSYDSIDHIQTITWYSKPHIWSQLRLMKAMGLIEEKFSDKKPRMKVYKLKPEYIIKDFEFFCSKFSEL